MYKYMYDMKLGGFIPKYQISRYNSFLHSQRNIACSSRKFTHGSCVFGIADLPQMVQSPRLCAHKMYETFQPAAFACIQEVIYNRTYGHGDTNYGFLDNYDFYRSLPQVLYQNTVEKSGFKCLWNIP